MIRDQCEPIAHYRYCLNRLIPQTNANASFSICEYFCFESDNVRDAKDMMGLLFSRPIMRKYHMHWHIKQDNTMQWSVWDKMGSEASSKAVDQYTFDM